MSDVVRFEETRETGELLKVDPAARGVDIDVRLATRGDFAFIDALQKSESDGLGFMVGQAIERRIEEGNILIAEAPAPEGEGGAAGGPKRIGYCLGLDRYQKRSELGVIYHIAVIPDYRRRNVAAALLQAQFEKSAYGTRLYCCWCKQSLAANRFWEAMGFVPLAFRAAGRTTIEKLKRKTGSAAGGVHIFWQKRIRAGDTQTPYWYPYETNGGAMMESRVILPLPPEVGWDEATPVVLPGAERRAAEQRVLEARVEAVSLREKEAKRAHRKGNNAKTPGRGRVEKAKQKHASRAVVGYGFGAGSGFGEPAEPPEAAKPDEALIAAERAAREAELLRIQEEKDAAKEALKRAQRKSDPELVAYARELRDRWQELVVARPGMLAGKCREKYAVGRLIAPTPGSAPAPGNAPAPGSATRIGPGRAPGSTPGTIPGSGPMPSRSVEPAEAKRLDAA